MYRVGLAGDQRKGLGRMAMSKDASALLCRTAGFLKNV
jgi:hypothetical protein